MLEGKEHGPWYQGGSRDGSDLEQIPSLLELHVLPAP